MRSVEWPQKRKKGRVDTLIQGGVTARTLKLYIIIVFFTLIIAKLIYFE
jgi:hypothetical protein